MPLYVAEHIMHAGEPLPHVHSWGFRNWVLSTLINVPACLGYSCPDQSYGLILSDLNWSAWLEKKKDMCNSPKLLGYWIVIKLQYGTSSSGNLVLCTCTTTAYSNGDARYCAESTCTPAESVTKHIITIIIIILCTTMNRVTFRCQVCACVSCCSAVCNALWPTREVVVCTPHEFNCLQLPQM